MADETRQPEHDFVLDERIVAYFLGHLPEVESEALEAELFAEAEVGARAFAIEDELVNDYARGGLSPAQRAAFEQHYLVTDERLERLEFARKLQQQLDTD